jgi:hypothetical protein
MRCSPEPRTDATPLEGCPLSWSSSFQRVNHIFYNQNNFSNWEKKHFLISSSYTKVL